jgi:hypothetical protein
VLAVSQKVYGSYVGEKIAKALALHRNKSKIPGL